MDLGPGFVTQQRSGEIALTLVDGVEQLETYFGRYLPQLLVAGFTPFVIFGFVAFVDLPVAGVLLVAAIVALFAPAAWHRFDTRKSLERERAYSAFAAEFLDSVQGLATLKSFGQSGARARLLAEKARELFRSTMWVLATNSLARGITDSVIAVGAAVALVLGAYRVSNNTMELTALLIILLLGIEIFRPMRDLRSVLHQGMVGKSAALSMYRILDATPEVGEKKEALNPNELKPTIGFHDIEFRYPGQREVVHDGLSFQVEQGERIGVVGPSGCGKSSIVRLLQRFHDPQGGFIQIGGLDVRDLTLDAVRSQISVVHQDTFLFHGTVRENLLMGNPEATNEELSNAASAANIHEFIVSLPAGYDTLIGEKGIKLSGGQRQRVAIARALLRDSPILVLDEALSAVDAENEAVILEALDRLMVGRTTLVLAHRLSSVINCDRILVLQDGNVIEQGSHLELIQQDGVYKHLMGEQARLQELPSASQSKVERFTEVTKVDGDYQDIGAVGPTEGIVQAEGLSWSQVVVILMRHILPWKGRITMTFGFGVLRVLAFVGVGVLSALIVFALKNGLPFQPFIVGLAIVAPISGVLHWCESWIAHDMAFRLLAELRIATFRKIDQLAPAYLTRRRTGDLMAIVTQDVEMIEYFFAHTVAPAFVSVLVPTGVIIILLGFSPWMALALSPFLIAVALSPFLMRDRVDQLGSRAREAAGELSAHAIDSIQGIAEIRAFQDEERRGSFFDQLASRHISLRLPYFEQLTLQQSLLEVFTGLGGLAVVTTGALLTSRGLVDPAVLPLLTILAMAAFLPISEIAEIGRQLADTLGATRRVYALENEPVPVADGPGVVLSTGDPSLVLRGVTFNYPGHNQLVLNQVSCEISPGQSIALVGPSGAGKTTLAHLLMRFWDPTGGVISIGDVDLRKFTLDELRSQMALVAQDTYLFNNTLEANIRIAKPTASTLELNQTLQFSALEDLVTTLPQGMNTPVGERGASLSGGQRQRVAIARAFLKDAPILILDEATSHLDALSEQAVHRALDQLKSNRTTIVIAHRLSTIRDADLILVLENGCIVQSGKHEDLSQTDGLYSRLVAHQITAAQQNIKASG
jgi:ATP-binding cassette subfamily C protein CydCD